MQDMDPEVKDKPPVDQKSRTPNDPMTSRLLYHIHDKPSILLSLFLGFQHFITMLGGTVTYPYILTSKLCMREDDPARTYVIATTMLCSGIGSLLQTMFGVRLPMIQGATFTFLVPTLAILSLPKWTCPSDNDLMSMRSANSSLRSYRYVTESEYESVWMSRMREVQGAIIASSLVEMILGLTGLMGIIMKRVTPLSIVPTIALIGLSLFKEATAPAGESWFVSGSTICLIIILSQYLGYLQVPVPFVTKEGNFCWNRMRILKMFPVLGAMVIVWVFCGVFTYFNWFPPLHPARTDGPMSRLGMNLPYLRVPYPFQWGVPTFTLSAVVGMAAGSLASAMESLGDYYAAARLLNVPPPPDSAVNRGIFFEGIGCMITGIFGSGGGLTSYSENVGAIGITGVGSRRVIVFSSFILIVLSFILPVSSFFCSLPIPIMGGVLMVMFSLCSGVGLSLLQFVDLNEPRNVFILGTSIFIGLGLPKWVLEHPETIRTGSPTCDQVIYVILSTSMFIGGLIAFFLDNTIPGGDGKDLATLIGISGSADGGKRIPEEEDEEIETVYGLPFGLNHLCKQIPFLKFIPISPTFHPRSFFEKESTHRQEDPTPSVSAHV